MLWMMSFNFQPGKKQVIQDDFWFNLLFSVGICYFWVVQWYRISGLSWIGFCFFLLSTLNTFSLFFSIKRFFLEFQRSIQSIIHINLQNLDSKNIYIYLLFQQPIKIFRDLFHPKKPTKHQNRLPKPPKPTNHRPQPSCPKRGTKDSEIRINDSRIRGVAVILG